MLYILGNYYCSDENIEQKIELEKYRLPHFIIKRNGEVLSKKNIEKKSHFLDRLHFRDRHISIALSNLGHLTKGYDKFYDLYNNVYKSKDIYTKAWRLHQYWEPYTDEQYNSLVSVIKKTKNDSDLYVNEDLIYEKSISKKNGVYYRNNYDEAYLDITPAFDIKKLKRLLKK